MNASVTVDGRSSAKPMVALILAFGLPFVIAWVFMFNPQWLPEGKRNLGTLVAPPVSLPDGPLTAIGGELLDPHYLQRQWTLVTWSRDGCGDTCREHIYQMRQIRRALREGVFRVQRLLLVAGGDTEELMELAGDYNGMPVIETATPVARSLLTLVESKNQAQSSGIVVIDPTGHLMMRYAPDASPKDVLKDMEHLLKASKTWSGSDRS